MRITSLSRVVFFLPLLLAPVRALSQFQEPNPEELKMTADPKAPGASAVILYTEETADDIQMELTYYERVKVLTEKGKELATVQLPYNHESYKIDAISGRTIHSDGSVYPLTTKPTDLMDFKTSGYQKNMAVFTLPNVEVGSILEYRMKVKYKLSEFALPTWHVQRPYFVHKAHYSYRPDMSIVNSAYSLSISGRIPDGTQLVRDKKGVQSLDVTDVPASPDEDWMPPINTFRFLIDFYFTAATSDREEYWKATKKSWAASVFDWTFPTAGLKKIADGIVSPADSEEVKAQKLYAAVMSLENTSFTRQKSEIERKKEKIRDIQKIEDIWTQKSGTSNGLAMLYVGLARAAGLKAAEVEVVNRDRAIFDPYYLTLYQYDDVLVSCL